MAVYARTRSSLMRVLDIPAEVKRVIVEQWDVDSIDIKPESKLIDDLGADSLALVELLLTLEETFEVDIPDEDAGLEKIVTVQDVVNYLEKRFALETA